MRAFRVGIVGAGLISGLHARGLRRLGQVDLVALADPDFARAKAKAAEHGIAGVFASQREMLDALNPDVVHVLTPPGRHAELCIEALEAGAHVYVEKPMASSEADCERMIQAAKRAGREICVGHNLLYHPLLTRALEAIAGGELGDIVHACAVYCFDPRRIPGYNSKDWYRRLGGGFAEDLAAHPASVLLRVIGRPRGITRVPAAEGVAALIEGERGAGSLLVSLVARPEDVSLRVWGTRGTLSVHFPQMVVSVQRERKLPAKLAHGVRNLQTARDFAAQTLTNTLRFVAKRMDTTQGIHTLIQRYYEALGAGRPAPVAPAEGREVVRLLRALWPAAGAGERPARWVLSPAQAQGTAPPGQRVRHALVTGATGFIGVHLVRMLAQRGVRVRALARDPRRAARIAHPNVEIVIGDFGDAAALDGVCEGVDTIFHLASVMSGSAEEFERVDLAGSRRLIDEAKRAGVGRIVFTSTLGAYALAGLPDGARVTEEMVDSPERVGNYARAKLRIEAMLMGEHRAGRFEAVVVRPGLVFGPGTSPYLEHLPHLGSLRGDRYVVFGDGNVPLQLTYIDNTVEALWLAATEQDASGQAFTIIDDDPPTQREFVRHLATLTGRPLGLATIPRPVAHLIGLAVEAAFAAMGKAPPTTRRLLLGKTAKVRFDTARAKNILGWRPAVPWREGMSRAVAHNAEAAEALRRTQSAAESAVLEP